jgi:hypothetical protein
VVRAVGALAVSALIDPLVELLPLKVTVAEPLLAAEKITAVDVLAAAGDMVAVGVYMVLAVRFVFDVLMFPAPVVE